MTNFERLISDKAKLAEIIGASEDFMADEVEPGWCHGVCPYKDLVEEHERIDFQCPVSQASVVMWWFEQEATD